MVCDMLVTAKGAVTVYEQDALVIEQITSTDNAAVQVVAGGTLTVNGSLTAAGANTVTLTTSAGAIELNQAITTASGNVTLTSAGNMTLGAAGDIVTTSGNVVIDSGGTREMTGETELNAGSGTLRLEAAGQITLGKLRTTNAADLPEAAAGARVSAIDAFHHAAKENIQTHGGMGFTWELDCHLYYRRAKTLNLALGSARVWKDRLVAHLEKKNVA
jgi:flagellar basal body rod protein FlgG